MELHTGSGPEPWHEAGGRVFDRWDLWYLVILTADCAGSWAELAARLRERTRGSAGSTSYQQLDWEAKRSQLADLRDRIEQARLDPSVLVAGLAEDRAVLRKARAKLFERAVADGDKTAAMRRTPRWLLEAQALRGEWDRFPVSPARFEPVFAGELGRRDFWTEKGSFDLCDRLEVALGQAGRRCGARPAELLALHRAGLTVLIGAMECVDDSCGVVGDFYGTVLQTYVGLPWPATGIAPEVYYRDLLNLATWEDYGLMFQRLGSLYAALPPEHLPLADATLRQIRSELLRREELGHQAAEALRLRRELHQARPELGPIDDPVPGSGGGG